MPAADVVQKVNAAAVATAFKNAGYDSGKALVGVTINNNSKLGAGDEAQVLEIPGVNDYVLRVVKRHSDHRN